MGRMKLVRWPLPFGELQDDLVRSSMRQCGIAWYHLLCVMLINYCVQQQEYTKLIIFLC